MDDRAVVEVQLGRPARSSVEIEARCHLGLPIVVDVPPILDDGTPFPTTHWLTCQLAVVRISRLESAGGVRAADALIREDAETRMRFDDAMDRYRIERDRRIPPDWTGPTPSGGVAGSSGGVKCLHAQYADTVAGNANPIGEDVAAGIEPLSCTVPCIIEAEREVVANPAWSEPP
jgi:uncharacterized protein